MVANLCATCVIVMAVLLNLRILYENYYRYQTQCQFREFADILPLPAPMSACNSCHIVEFKRRLSEVDLSSLLKYNFNNSTGYM